MIRTTITPDKRDLTLNIPQQFVGKKVEITLVLKEDIQNSEPIYSKPALAKKEVLENVKQGFKEMEMVREGKIKAISMDELFDELK